MSGPLFQPTKSFIVIRGNELVIGSEGQTIRIPGGLKAEALSIEQPYQNPQTAEVKAYQTLYTDGFTHEWKEEKIQTLISKDHAVGLDYLFIN